AAGCSRFGTWGTRPPTALVNVAGTALLLVLLRRRLRRIGLARTADATLRIVAAAIVVAAVSYGVWRGLDEGLGRSLWAQLVSVGTALAVGTAAYLVSCRLLGVRELNALLALRERLRRR